MGKKKKHDQDTEPRRLSTTTGLDRDLRVCVCVWQGAGSDFPQGLCVLHQCQSALIRSLFVPSSWGLGLSWRAGARSNRVTMSSFGLFRQLLHGRGQVHNTCGALPKGHARNQIALSSASRASTRGMKLSAVRVVRGRMPLFTFLRVTERLRHNDISHCEPAVTSESSKLQTESLEAQGCCEVFAEP